MKNSQYPIIIEDYDPEWPLRFARLKDKLQSHLGDLILSIEHVGSTSVPGLAAKPIIDLDIIIAEEEGRMAAVLAKLQPLGYTHVGDYGIPGREAFKHHFTTEHHLYACLQNSIGLKNHLLLRDYLRSKPQAVLEYGALKKKLAQQYPYNIDAYIEGKTAFITEILSKEGLSQQSVDEIVEQNKFSK